MAIGSLPSSSLSELEAVGTPADCSASAWSATMMIIKSDVNGEERRREAKLPLRPPDWK